MMFHRILLHKPGLAVVSFLGIFPLNIEFAGERFRPTQHERLWLKDALAEATRQGVAFRDKRVQDLIEAWAMMVISNRLRPGRTSLLEDLPMERHGADHMDFLLAPRQPSPLD